MNYSFPALSAAKLPIEQENGGDMQSYDYAHRTGVDDISWDRFAQLAARLSEQLAALQIHAVVGIARAGLFPATAVACALRRDLFPVRSAGTLSL